MSGRYTEGGDELFLGEAVAEGADYMDAIDAKVDDSERWYWVCDPETLDMGGAYAPRGCVTAQHHPSGVVNFHDYGLAFSWRIRTRTLERAQDRALAVAFNFRGASLAIAAQLTALVDVVSLNRDTLAAECIDVGAPVDLLMRRLFDVPPGSPLILP